MATKSKRKPKGIAAARKSVVAKKPTPWGTIIAVIAVVALAAGVFGYYYFETKDKREAAAAQKAREDAAKMFTPSPQNPDPSLQIPGIVTQQYAASVHVAPTERVAYDKTPPFGGPHDGAWAACTGIVYPNAVRTENMVHALEHGAIWIAYNPDQVTGDAVTKLKQRVEDKPYSMMSPYPGLDRPISLQSWGHQLKVDNADDPRIDQFITALRLNQSTYPEVGASCDALGVQGFDPDNPPPFDPTPPGPAAKPMDYQGTPGVAGDNPGGAPAPGG